MSEKKTTTLTTLHGNWVDDNGNTWDMESYSQVTTLEYSHSLENCKKCHNCRNCRNCDGCRLCVDCKGCIDCQNCDMCCGCNNCTGTISCSFCIGGTRLVRCIHARACTDCINVDRVWDFAANPDRLSRSHIGSRDSTVTAYWLGKQSIVVTGCFRGDLQSFTAAVCNAHPEGSKHRNDYLKFVKHVEEMMHAQD